MKKIVHKIYRISSRFKNKRTTTYNKILYYFHKHMYLSVLESSFDMKNCEHLNARAISLAACGDFEKAKETVELLMNSPTLNCNYFYVSLADALVPFMPKTAAKILEKVDAPLTLETALLLKLGEKQKAYALLLQAIKNKAYRNFPELLLYYANAADKLRTQEQLTLLNKYLLMYKLPKVRFKNREEPVSTLNIECRKQKIVHGPLVTVIMTTFNTGKRVNVAIESILSQSYENIELIVVDDASNDDTVQIINELIQKDKRVKLLQLAQNVGTYVAKNIALLQANGKFITCHDSDDCSHPLKIEKQVKPLLKNRRLMATISSWVRLSDRGEYYARPVHPLMRQNPSSLMFRKEQVLKYAGIWDTVRTGADSEYIARLKLVFGRKKVKRIKEPLSFGAHRENSLMTSSETGYCDLGISPQRLEYWEAWGHWHIDEVKKGKKAFLSTDLLEERPFKVPREIDVDKKMIKIVLENLKMY